LASSLFDCPSSLPVGFLGSSFFFSFFFLFLFSPFLVLLVLLL
jgi:hypothetical protein